MPFSPSSPSSLSLLVVDLVFGGLDWFWFLGVQNLIYSSMVFPQPIQPFHLHRLLPSFPSLPPNPRFIHRSPELVVFFAGARHTPPLPGVWVFCFSFCLLFCYYCLLFFYFFCFYFLVFPVFIQSPCFFYVFLEENPGTSDS